MIQVKFTTHGASSAFGAFGPGDTARVSPEMAQHFVEVMKCAKYLSSAETPQESVAVAEVAPKPRKKHK